MRHGLGTLHPTNMKVHETHRDLTKIFAQTLKSIKSSKSENSYFPALAKFICENLEVSEFENDKAMDPRTVIGYGSPDGMSLDPIKVKSMDKIYAKVLENDFDVSYDEFVQYLRLIFKSMSVRWRYLDVAIFLFNLRFTVKP